MMRSINTRVLVPGAFLAVLLVLELLAGCGSGSGSGKTLVVAATSDLQESGILDAWMKDFRKQSGIQVQLVTVSDQDALSMAMHGECDALITHLPQQEADLQKSNYVEGRQEIMHDDYLIVGPPNDPGGIRGTSNAAEAFKKIGTNKNPFVFRSDNSGVSFKESELWGLSGIQDFGDWLIQTDSGMADALGLASDKGAYTLSDRSTFENLAGGLNLEVIFEDKAALVNPYSVMEVSQLAYPDTNLQDAQKLADYLASSKAQSYFNLGSWEAPAQPDSSGGE
jgi:tungstate transport system substrate-binding protein